MYVKTVDDYKEATGDVGINDSVKKTIMMQLLPPALKVATRDNLMAAQQSFRDVNPEYLKTVIVQRCEFDEAAMGSAIPMDAAYLISESARRVSFHLSREMKKPDMRIPTTLRFILHLCYSSVY